MRGRKTKPERNATKKNPPQQQQTDNDDSELPSSSSPLPLPWRCKQPHEEHAPLLIPNMTSPLKESITATATTKTATPPPATATRTPQRVIKQSRNVRVGSEVWIGLLDEEAEPDDTHENLRDENNKNNNNNLSSSGKEREQDEKDPWKDYVETKNGEVDSLTDLQQQQQQHGVGDDNSPQWSYHDGIEPARGVLPEDTFSFLATCPIRSKSFVVAIGTMATQLIVLCLLAVDSIDFHQQQDNDLPRNNLSVPATSVIQVSIGQFLALMITSVSQTDCLQSLMLLHYGYPEHRIRDVLAMNNNKSIYNGKKQQQQQQQQAADKMWKPHSSMLQVRWYVSMAARFIVGFFTGIVTFLLVVRSETVRDAVEFVSVLDDTAYLLGTVGFFGRHVREETENPIYDRDALVRHPKLLSRTRISMGRGKKLKKCLFTFTTRMSLFWINMGLLTYIVVGQYNGRYLPPDLLVQMGDESSSLLSTHSGIYHLSVSGMGEFEYKERSGNGAFKWCEEEGAWTLLVDDAGKDNCAGDWQVKSTELEQFAGMLAVADEPWYVTEVNNIELEADFVRVVSMLGVTTECDKGVYGWTCSFRNVCQTISIDGVSGPFQDQRLRGWPTLFTIFPGYDVRVYEHPVYYHRESPDYSADLIIFTGRQWAMLNTDAWTTDSEILSDEQLVEILDGFRVYAFEGDLGIGFLSDFVNIGTNNDKGTPNGLRWFEVELTGEQVRGVPEINERIVVKSQFYCAVCNDSDRPCFYDAPCVDGKCVCDSDNLGSICEVVPSGDAFCNPSFNRPVFNYDGGDCCQLTCIDTPEQKCLKSRDGLIDYGNALCRDRSGFYRRQLPLDEPDFKAEMPDKATVAAEIALTESGRSYAISYRIVDETVMGTRVGTTWTHFGRNHQFGGFRNEIVTQFPNAISSQQRSLPIRGLAASFKSRNLVPFFCNVLGCQPHNIGEGNFTSLVNTVVPEEFGMENYWDPFTLSPDGHVMARGVTETTDQGVAYFIDLYVYDEILGWVYTYQRVDLSIDRTVDVDEGTPCYDTEGVSLPTFLEDNQVDLMDILTVSNLTVPEFLVALNIDYNLPANATDATVSDVDLLASIPLEEVPLDFFLEVVNFGDGAFGIVFCEGSILREIFTAEAPLYLSLSDLRSDRTRRLSVGSISFIERSPAELLGPLTTRVFEISESGEIFRQGRAVEIIDKSDRNGKSQRPEFGIPKKSVSLSRDGNVLVVGSLYLKGSMPEGLVKVFEWSGIDWRVRQELSLRENGILSSVLEGWTNLLSEDGSVLAVTFPRKSSVYRWNGTEYNILSEEWPFGTGTDVSLSRMGETAAFAVPIQGGFGAYVFSNDEAPWCNSTTELLMRVSFTPTTPSSFAWRLVSSTGAVVASGSWPETSTPDPLKRQVGRRSLNDQRRRLLLEEQSVYDRNDPSDLTFVYDRCITLNVCSQVYRDDNLGDEWNLGVVYGRSALSSGRPPANISSTACLLKFESFEQP